MYFAPYIDGHAIETSSAEYTDVVNPATQLPFAKVSMAKVEHMRSAVEAAHRASSAWGSTLAAKREFILQRAAEVLESSRQEFVDLLIDEGGSTFGKAQFEVTLTVGILRSAAGEARRIEGQIIPADIPGLISMAIRKPLGVVGGISPFNFPLILSMKKLAFALAAGNTFVLKPAEEASLLGLKIPEVFERAGLPCGVLNVVPGDGRTVGAALIEDPRVKLISFTGSTEVGKRIAFECAKQGKRVVLELGGKSPVVVLKDADVEYAVSTCCFGMFIHQGQICMAGSRIIVEAPIYELFLSRFTSKVRTLKVGDPRNPETVIGPLIHASKCQMVDRNVKQAVAAGARLTTGGSFSANIYEPTVLADVTPQMNVFREELFGPVVTITRAEDEDHALLLANDSEYGLSAAVLTNDLQAALRFARDLEAGMVHVNGPTVHDEPHVPFGGIKDSGNGREGGRWSMNELTELKWVTIQTGRRSYPF